MPGRKNTIKNFWEKVNKNGKQQLHMETKCWNWLGRKDFDGYGSFHFNNKNFRAHRFVMIILQEKTVPEGMLVCHHCDNPSCVRPDHLFIGTIQDNIDDMIQKGRNVIPMLGLHHSEKTKKKISASKIGKKRTQEQINKSIIGRKGYRHSEETKRKISIANKGKLAGDKGPMYGRRGVLSPHNGDKSPFSKLTWDEVREIRKVWKNSQNKKGLMTKLSKLYGMSLDAISNVVKNRSWRE